MSKILNINIGLLGHVDSGKTSLAKCLSQIGSTACFDKHPQSKERGITIDLGFSSFSISPFGKFKDCGYEKIQFTLVDCPGHASLIRTVIGGIHIIDLVILVIDIKKGVQTQTAECLVISQLSKKQLVVVLNKIDLVEPVKRNEFVAKVKSKLQTALSECLFNDTAILPIVAKEGYCGDRGIVHLIDKLKEVISIPTRVVHEPFVLSVDHCFLMKGKGTVLTGTVLQGAVKLNDDIEIPILKEIKKVKSIQMFRCDVSEAIQGDRIGICVKQFDPSLLERGVVCCPGYLSLLYGVIIRLNKIKYFKGDISSNAKYHISVGYETLIGKLTLFTSDKSTFDFENDYPFIEKFDEELTCIFYALIEFEKPVYVPPSSIVIGSKLDVNVNTNSCRLAFFGDIVHGILDKNYHEKVLPNLKLFIIKEKNGIVQNVLSETEVIGCKLWKQQSSSQKFMNFKIALSTGEIGYIDSSFGQKDKIRIRIPNGLKEDTFELLSSNKKQKGNRNTPASSEAKKEPVKISLRFKRYIFDNEKKLSQYLMP